jgi:hypothetical protein
MANKYISRKLAGLDGRVLIKTLIFIIQAGVALHLTEKFLTKSNSDATLHYLPDPFNLTASPNAKPQLLCAATSPVHLLHILILAFPSFPTVISSALRRFARPPVVQRSPGTSAVTGIVRLAPSRLGWVQARPGNLPEAKRRKAKLQAAASDTKKALQDPRLETVA